MRLLMDDGEVWTSASLQRRFVRSPGDRDKDSDRDPDVSRSYYCYANPNDFGCNPAYIAAAVMSSLLIVTALLGVIIFLCVRHANAKRMLRVQAQLGAHERAIFTVQQQQEQQQQHGSYPMSLMFPPEPPAYNCEDYTLPPESPQGAGPPPPYEEHPTGVVGSVTSLFNRLFSGRRNRPQTAGAGQQEQQQQTTASGNSVASIAAAADIVEDSAASVDPNKPRQAGLHQVARLPDTGGSRDDMPPVS